MSDFKFTSHKREVIEAKNAAIERALEAIGLTAEAYGKYYITKEGAVDTGNLRNSISHTHDENNAYVGTNVEYAVYVEMGTSKMEARPYIRPAVLNHIDNYKRIVDNYMKGD